MNGELRPVRGVLAIAQEARTRGRKQLIVPKRVAVEASVVQGIEIIGVNDLREAVQYLKGEKAIEPEPCRAAEYFQAHAVYGIDFSEVKGQQDVKRAIEVAVAAGHNLLMVGPHGTGKSMLAKRIPTIMPGMSEDEAVETTKIHSAGGLLGDNCSFIATRPSRPPHTPSVMRAFSAVAPIPALAWRAWHIMVYYFWMNFRSSAAPLWR